MNLVFMLMLLLSQAAMADMTTRKTYSENCQGPACPARQEGGVGGVGSSSTDVREAPEQDKKSPHPTAGAGGEPPGALFKNQPPKQNRKSPKPTSGAGGEPPGAAYKNRPAPAPTITPK
jgi:hypothetical protein